MSRGFEVTAEDGLPVSLPSGANFSVLTQDEVDYVKDRVTRYLTDNHFQNVADLQDVDRMVVMEMLVYRWQLWLSRGRDYFDDDIDDRALRASVNDYSTEVRQLKKQLGIDKVSRDKARGDDSVSDYLSKLRDRAEAFGVTRENQLGKALELFQQLNALMTLMDNTDEIEKREMHCDADDVIDWIRTIAIPEFQAIDAHFREHEQRLWVSSM